LLRVLCAHFIVPTTLIPRKRLQLRNPNDEEPLVDDIVETGDVRAAVYTQDGSQFALLAEGGESNPRQFAILRWDVEARRSLPAIPLPGYGVGGHSLAYSPDGQLLACRSPYGSGERMVVWDVRSSNARVVFQQQFTDGHSPIAFNANGQVITDGRVFSISDQRPRWQFACSSIHSASHRPFQVSANSKVIATCRIAGAREQICVIDAATGALLRICP
jgi:hypothetical protein